MLDAFDLPVPDLVSSRETFAATRADGRGYAVRSRGINWAYFWTLADAEIFAKRLNGRRELQDTALREALERPAP